MLSWCKPFNIFCFLDNQQYTIGPQQYECLLAAGALQFVEGTNLQQAEAFFSRQQAWYFGHLSYSLSNTVYNTSVIKEERIGFPDLFFFIPEILALVKNGTVQITASDPQGVFTAIQKQPVFSSTALQQVQVQARLTQQQYLQKIASLQAHILRGDCYEINFCQEFFSENAGIHPLQVYEQLMAASPNPFSAFYRVNDAFLMCASPERFLKKQGNSLIAQPIKGTAPRGAESKAADEKTKAALRQSAKEQAENVMIVDLMRNDLSQICESGTVQVAELFGIYSFPQVHQMISTISGSLKPNTGFKQIFEASFPMGSMTGAPKRRVLELIEAYEPQNRGIFSGSVGYVQPNGDFDFNVVIRSIMYNQAEKYLSYQVGSGITIYSQPQQEWEECRLKAAAINQVLQHQ